LLRDTQLCDFDAGTKKIKVNRETLEPLAVLIDVIEDKVRGAKGYMAMIEALALRADSVFKGKAPVSANQ
ncbi:MAG: hypothetical protein ACREOP_03380, partial [Thermodesulfobacteriota bacterium]